MFNHKLFKLYVAYRKAFEKKESKTMITLMNILRKWMQYSSCIMKIIDEQHGICLTQIQWNILQFIVSFIWHKYSEISWNLLFLSFDTNTVKYLAIYWFFVKNIIVSGIAIRKQHTYRVTLYVIFWTWQHFIEFIKFIDKIRFTCSTIYSCRAL